MCGIVGYVGPRPALPHLLQGLRRLEYRGYDSAGVALVTGQGIWMCKQSGKVAALAAALETAPASALAASCGIAHTRWATHGAPTQANAHPHSDPSGRFAVVHNGIVENYSVIRTHFQNQGHVFKSETDTEVIAHLLAECYQGDLAAAVGQVLRRIVGACGIAVVCADRPGEIIVARRGSPIVIGLGTGENFVASDSTALIAHTREVIYLDDNDLAVLTASGVEVRSLDNTPVVRTTTEITGEIGATEKGGYEHFMLKEIFEQPEALRNTLRGRLDLDLGTATLSGLNLTPRDIAALRRVLLVGCGTSRHAGLVGEYALEDFADMPAEVEQAAEFRYRNPIINSQDLLLAISQSGETADTLAAVREAIQKGAIVAGLCNVVGSTIAREAGRGIYLHAGPEISVASTKAFTSQVAALLMVALKFARGRRLPREEGMQLALELRGLPDLVEAVLEQNDAISLVAERYAAHDRAFFIGRGYLFPVALEGALKLKEISYVHAEGYHAAELKHGPIAMLDERMPVVALLNDIPGRDKTLSNAHECKARGAPVLGIITEGDIEAKRLCDDVIELPPSIPCVSPIPTAVALQLLAYHIARLRGCPIDQPRNLAKSVTVE